MTPAEFRAAHVTYNFHAGRLLWRAIRDAVSQAKFHGYDIEIWEGGGFLSRDFILKGDTRAIQPIADWLNSLAKEDCVNDPS